MEEYIGMYIRVETGLGGRKVYRVIRIKADGTETPTPWTNGSVEGAESYIRHHGFDPI